MIEVYLDYGNIDPSAMLDRFTAVIKYMEAQGIPPGTIKFGVGPHGVYVEAEDQEAAILMKLTLP